MNQFKRSLTRILNILAGISFLTMVALTCWQVFTRYVLKNPSTWSEELVSCLFAWASLLGAVLVTRERGHMNIPILIEACGETWQKILNCLCELVGFIFSAVILLYGGIRISSLAMGQMTSSLSVAVGVFYVILPLAGILNMVYSLLNIGAIRNSDTDSAERKVD